MINFGNKQNLPWLTNDREIHWSFRGMWQAYWLQWGGTTTRDTVCVYRLFFTSAADETLYFSVSGDNRYRLFCDGRQISSGPEAGDLNNYFYNRVCCKVSAGKHVLTAIVFDFKDLSSYAHISLRPGFLLAEEQEANRDRFNTGFAPWEVLANDAMEWKTFIMLYPTVCFHADRWNRSILKGDGSGWQKAEKAEQAGFAGIRNEYGPERLMREAILPCSIYDRNIVKTEKIYLCDTDDGPITSLPGKETETLRWLDLFNNGVPCTLPAGRTVRIIGVMDNYYCVYPKLHTDGGYGTEISLAFAESCYDDGDYGNDIKGNREEVEGKFFRKCYAESDVFYPDGKEMEFFTPHWRSGRIFELVIKTGNCGLTVKKVELAETRYPLEAQTLLTCDDENLNALLPMCWRTLQMCTHETFMDCPYYEQLMYAGDSRLEALVNMAGSADDRVVRKMISMFAASQMPSGFLQSRYPCRVTQIIPPFSLMWIGSLYDFAMLRNDRDFVRSHMGHAQKIIAAFENHINSDGLIEFAQGWNFMDWTPSWSTGGNVMGTPPGAEYGVSPVLNLLYVYALKLMSELSRYTGYSEMADYYLRRGKTIAEITAGKYFDAKAGLIAEDTAGGNFCEHSQCLAILSGLLPPETDAMLRKNLFSGKVKMAECTIYFSHYYFEVCRLTGNAGAFFNRLELWSDNVDLGLKTLMERPDPSRSDCHAWSSHPWYHTVATLGGIRPAEMGFASVEISPMPGHLRHLTVQMIHPGGMISAEYRIDNNTLYAVITLPEGLSGTFRFAGATAALHSGCNEIKINTNRGLQ